MNQDPKTMSPVEMSAQELARCRAEEAVRQELLRGGHTAEMRGALQTHLVALVGEQVAREEAARPREADLPLDIAATDPRDAAEQAEQIRKDPRFFKHRDYTNRREIEALHEQAAFLDRRAMALPDDIRKMTPDQARAKSAEVYESLSHQHLTREQLARLEREIDFLDRRANGAE